MDDPTRTRKTLDDLADLFLTGTGPVPRSNRESNPPSQAVPPQPAPEKIRNVPPTDALEGPPSMPLFPRFRKGPALAGTHAIGPAISHRNTPHHPFIPHLPPNRPSGATFRLHPTPDQQQQQADTCQIQVVLLGNLPGFNGPWLTQYAHRLTQAYGSVGVISVREKEIDIDVVASDERMLDQLETCVSPEAIAAGALSTQLDILAQPVKTWLVHFPTPLTPQTRHQMLTVNQWTLLCGADDAAVVGAYRLLKQLAAIPSQAPLTNKNPVTNNRRIGVMIMGSDETTGRTTGKKLTQTASGFLKTTVEWIGSYKQMQPVHTRPLCTFVGHSQDLWSQLKYFLDQRQNTPQIDNLDQTTHHRATLTAPEPAETVKIKATNPIDRLAINATEPPKQAATGLGGPGELGAPETLQQHDLEPTQSIPTQDNPLTTEEPTLCSFVKGQVERLEACCPYQPKIQLGLDQEGRVHLLAHHTDIQPPSNSEDQLAGESNHVSLRGAIMDLMQARHWVQEHLKLLQLTHRHQSFNDQIPVTMHLFTNEAQAAVTLIGQQGSLVTIHLLQNIHLGQASCWSSTDLN